ncbi:hypothetical protein [Kocuria rosea]|uniref:hypothetical protein n=1 Tax=Kocuria rosea TaxID=1275 RepID=UPI00203B86D9|nr:hypothetical protein [Kocuria rosea]
MPESEERQWTARDSEDAYQDIKATLKATRQLAMSVEATRSRIRLANAIELAEELLKVSFWEERQDLIIAVALPPHVLRRPIEPLKHVQNKPTSKTMDVAAGILLEWVGECVAKLTEMVENSLEEDRRSEVRGALRALSESLTVTATLEKLKDAEEEAAKSRDRVREAEVQVSESRDLYQEVTAEAGASELSKDFEEYATKEAKSASFWTWGSILGLLFTAGAAYWLLLFDDGAFSVADLGRLAVTLPLAAAAVYAARVGGHHRQSAQWAHSTAVQLKTIRAYSDSLSDDLKNSLRHEFGMRAFGSPTSNNEVAVPPAATTDAEALVQRLTDLVRTVAETAKSPSSSTQ